MQNTVTPSFKAKGMHSIQSEFAEAGSIRTDKIAHHGYHRFYPWFLGAFRGKPVRVLEIGLDQLGSIDLWRRYFPENLDLHGLDRDEKTPDGENVTFHKVDQSNPAELRQFAASAGKPFNVILDDGSHIPEHQLLSLEVLWPLLSPGGIYILEDTETSFWGKSELYGYRFDSRISGSNLIHQLRAAIDAVNFEFLPWRARQALKKHRLGRVLDEVEMISFGQNCVVLLKKDVISFGQYYGREYVLQYKVMSHDTPIRLRRGIRRYGIVGFVRQAISRLFSS
jgi:hypothetical protein